MKMLTFAAVIALSTASVAFAQSNSPTMSPSSSPAASNMGTNSTAAKTDMSKTKSTASTAPKKIHTSSNMQDNSSAKSKTSRVSEDRAENPMTQQLNQQQLSGMGGQRSNNTNSGAVGNNGMVGANGSNSALAPGYKSNPGQTGMNIGGARQNCSTADRDCAPQPDGSNKSAESPTTPRALNNTSTMLPPQSAENPNNCSASMPGCTPSAGGSSKTPAADTPR